MALAEDRPLVQSTWIEHVPAAYWVLALVLLVADCYLWWWAWLELKGVTVSAGAITFPARIPLWPGYMPYRMVTIDLETVDHARDGRSGKNLAAIALKTASGDRQVVFDSPPTREMIMALLALRQVPMVRQ